MFCHPQRMPAEPDDSTALTWRSRTIDEGKIVTISQVSQDIQQAEFARSSAPSAAFETAAQSRSAIHEAILTTSIEDTLLLRRFTLEEYHRLIKIGFLSKKDKLELLEGLLVMRPRISPLHAHTSSKLHRVFSPLYGREKTMLRIRGPVSIPESDSEPEPDLTLYVGGEADHWERHPYPCEINLIAEISESTLRRDRFHKGRIYAQAGILEYWIVNLPDKSLEIYRHPCTPSAGGALYQTKLTFRRGDSLKPLAFPDFEVAVDDVLPLVNNDC